MSIGTRAIGPDDKNARPWPDFVRIENAFLGDQNLRIKIASDRDDTVWFKITPDQLNAIEKIIIGEEDN